MITFPDWVVSVACWLVAVLGLTALLALTAVAVGATLTLWLRCIDRDFMEQRTVRARLLMLVMVYRAKRGVEPDWDRLPVPVREWFEAHCGDEVSHG